MNDKQPNTDLVQQIDLQYLMNPDQQKRLAGKFNENMISHSDSRFYRKRILQLTKDLISGEHKNSSLDASFSEYMSECVKYLKFIDKKDEIQQDYEEINRKQEEQRIEKIKKNILKDKKREKDTKTNKNSNEETEEISTAKNPDEYLMCKPEPTTGNINDFIKIKKSNVRDRNTILPKQKDINLRDPKLKRKGLKKKKNG